MRLAKVLLTWASLCVSAAAQADDAITAAQEFRTICGADAGALWGVSLCGPLLIVDPSTRAAWGTQPDSNGVLSPSDNQGGWVGTLPPNIGIANTAADWGGVRWSMILAPLPTISEERRVLLAHEAWHRIQDQIGLSAVGSDNAHLSAEQGRYFMRLEMRALATALMSASAARRRAALDALAFRRARLALFPDATSDEAALDRNEGLAAYTGVKLGAGQNAAIFAARSLGAYDRHSALARAYAYATGPAYGLLLDEFQPDWRRRLTNFAPADLLAMALRAPQLSDRQLSRLERRYGGPTVAREERDRAAAERTRVAELRNRYSVGPRLVLPLSQAQMEFDPNQVTPVDGLGSYYSRLTLRDRWGEIIADEGALISADFQWVSVAQPAPDGQSGPGWRLRLAPGLVVVEPGADGAWRVPSPPETTQ